MANFDFTDELECIYGSELGYDASLLIKSTNTTLTLRGIYENPYFKRKFGDFIVDAEDPWFETIWQDDFSDARQGDELTIDGDVYFLQSEPQREGSGPAVMLLTPASTQDDSGNIDPEDEGTEKPTEAGSGMSGNLFNP